MGAKHADPIRMELTHLKKELAMTIHGRRFLEDRQDELMCQLLDLVCENETPREKTKAGTTVVNQDFVLVCSGITNETLNVALMTPKQEVYLETETKNVMSVETPVLKYKTRTSGPNGIHPHGLVFTSSDLGDAIESLADLLPDIPRLAGYEGFCQLMAAETEKTRRRVSALEHVMIPDTQSNIHYVTMKLNGNKWSPQTRFMKAKDMVLEEAYHYSEREVVPMVDKMQ